MTLTVLADHDGSQQQHPRKRTPTQLMLTYGDESTLLIIFQASIWCPSNARTQSTLLVPTVSRASSQPAEQKHHYSICTCRMPNSTLRNQTLRLETCHRKQIDPSLQCQPGSPPCPSRSLHQTVLLTLKRARCIYCFGNQAELAACKQPHLQQPSNHTPPMHQQLGCQRRGRH